MERVESSSGKSLIKSRRNSEEHQHHGSSAIKRAAESLQLPSLLTLDIDHEDESIDASALAESIGHSGDKYYEHMSSLEVLAADYGCSLNVSNVADSAGESSCLRYKIDTF